jgi:hypothetical protein
MPKRQLGSKGFAVTSPGLPAQAFVAFSNKCYKFPPERSSP